MEALSKRKTSRSFSQQELTLQQISNLLWAGFGVNRAEGNLRTAPSAMNRQEIDIYVSMATGTYLYNAPLNQLELVLKGDIREATGKQPFVKDAPINLVFVADYSKMGDGDEQSKMVYAAADAGFISQNIYLFCASEGLATVVRGWIDKDSMKQVMGLRPEQHVVFAQTVGYPAE